MTPITSKGQPLCPCGGHAIERPEVHSNEVDWASAITAAFSGEGDWVCSACGQPIDPRRVPFECNGQHGRLVTRGVDTSGNIALSVSQPYPLMDSVTNWRVEQQPNRAECRGARYKRPRGLKFR